MIKINICMVGIPAFNEPDVVVFKFPGEPARTEITAKSSQNIRQLIF